MVKRGRKTKPHQASWGETIDGLYHCPDGRWRIVETGEKFTEPEERLAVLRFRQWQARKAGKVVGFDIPLKAGDSSRVIRRVLQNGNLPDEEHVLVIEQSPTIHRITSKAGDPVTLLKQIPEDVLWVWFKNQIIERPAYVAQQTGIEQIGYLADLAKPMPSPTMEEVGVFYLSKVEINAQTKWNSNKWWREFCDAVKVAKLRELTQSMVTEYYESVRSAAKRGGYSPTYCKSRFSGIKTILAYPLKYGQWAEDCQRALGYCGVFQPPKPVPTNPAPISREDFNKLFDGANGATAFLKPMMLVSLNCLFYPSDAADLQWKDLDLTKGMLSNHRTKTGIPRIGVLWKDTIEALNALPRKSDYVFNTTAKVITRHFRDLRKVLGLAESVKYRDIRDGGYTAAIEAGASMEAVEMLAGHRLAGVKDNYLKRNPGMTKEACEAIHKAYRA